MLSDAVGKAVEANERAGDGGIGGRRGLAIGSMVWRRDSSRGLKGKWITVKYVLVVAFVYNFVRQVWEQENQ